MGGVGSECYHISTLLMTRVRETVEQREKKREQRAEEGAPDGGPWEAVDRVRTEWVGDERARIRGTLIDTCKSDPKRGERRAIDLCHFVGRYDEGKHSKAGNLGRRVLVKAREYGF